MRGFTLSVPAVVQSRKASFLPHRAMPRLAAGVECGRRKVGMWSPKSGEMTKDTQDLRVPNRIHRSPAVSTATEDFRAGDTVHLERGTRASPWLGGGGQSLL